MSDKEKIKAFEAEIRNRDEVIKQHLAKIEGLEGELRASRSRECQLVAERDMRNSENFALQHEKDRLSTSIWDLEKALDIINRLVK